MGERLIHPYSSSPAPQSDKQGPKALDEFCRDLCAEVRSGKVDPVSQSRARPARRRWTVSLHPSFRR